MAQDDTIAAVLETYAEDTCEPNDKGQIVWCESSDGNVGNYVNYLISSLNIDKSIYSWAHQLITYGDSYLRLYHESDYGEDLLFGNDKNKSPSAQKTLNESVENELRKIEDKELKEDVNVQLHQHNDHYVHYVEMVPNPGEMFELTRFGKTMGFIKASVSVQKHYETTTSNMLSYVQYKMKKGDVDVYDATDFVHAALEDSTNRVPETVDIYFDDDNYNKDNKNKACTYTVRTGQSLLYNSFQVWRELSLLENSVLLNRLTKSAIVRVLNVDVGDMPKEQVTSFMARLKEKIEQKSAVSVGSSMQEYTNPGPIENIIYVPTHGTQGQITAQAIGGDVDPKQLTDLSYFQNKLFGSLRVPKQFFAQTDDSAGFNGGSSLSIISSRYGKAVKRIQNTLCQEVTDIINLFLLDKGLFSYINKFTIRMQAPITQEEVDRRTNKDNRIRYVGDIMQQLGDIDDPATKYKILKSLLTPVVNDSEVIDILQEYIDNLEKAKEEPKTKEQTPKSPMPETLPESSAPEEEPTPMPKFNSTEEETAAEGQPEEQTAEQPQEQPAETIQAAPSETASNQQDSYLPSPSEIGVNMVNNK
jgi:ribosome-associated translation inhibitor RaiA